MRILISDYIDSMMPNHELEIETLRKGLGQDVRVDILPYNEENKEQFYMLLKEADALLSAFIKIDGVLLDRAPNLKVISLNMTGWDTVDLAEATKHGVGVCSVGEYCTWDVAESAVAYMYALNKHFKIYQHDIEIEHKWNYGIAPMVPRIQNQMLGIFGFGKIGKCTARKARSLVKGMVACDPYASQSTADELGVELVSPGEIYERCDIIINHMNLTPDNRHMFNMDAFRKMKHHPIFINLGRGLSTDEGDLIDALDEGLIRAFGCDVLYDETPDLTSSKLVGRDNVIITPHAAFYSTTSICDLETISAQNIVYYLLGQKDKVFKLLN